MTKGFPGQGANGTSGQQLATPHIVYQSTPLLRIITPFHGQYMTMEGVGVPPLNREQSNLHMCCDLVVCSLFVGSYVVGMLVVSQLIILLVGTSIDKGEEGLETGRRT